MSKFASTKNAVGICARSGRKMALSAMIMDPRLKLMVDPAWADIKHPVERPINADDASGLRHPAPDIDDDSPGASGQTVVQALFPTGPHFGGGT
jgi:hypothetical protein